uniref:DDE Tnp4 domain-containing protein n=1 Tax=Araucaria cunninghamii TaxID=56994 RepID=A0A0D6R5D3_ARACU
MEENTGLKRKREDEDEGETEEETAPAVEGEEEEEEEGSGVGSSAGLQGFMCFSSLQTLLTMELCRDLRPPGGQDSLYSGTSGLIPMAFMKLILVAAASLYEEHEGRSGGGGRQCWKVPRAGSEWSRISRGAYQLDAAARDALFRRKYSMSYACFVYLVEELRPFIQSECSFFVRAPLEVERAVALVIFRLAHGLSARQVAENYNVGASTVGKYTLIVTAALADPSKLYSRYVAIPTGDRLARVTTGFEHLTNLPNMCGALDGTHLKLYFKPARHYYSSASSPPTYKFHSVFLQAVCDTNRVFWHVSCGGDGSLRQKIRDGVALQEPVVPVRGVGVPVKPFVVARRGFPIEPFCITPFGSGDGLRRAFDEQLLRGFSCIEEAFRILKTRWKILRCMNVHLIHASQLAVACCMLHNICQLWGEPDPEDMQSEGYSGGGRLIHGLHRTDEQSRLAGEEIREALFKDWVRRSLEESSPRPVEHT